MSALGPDCECQHGHRQLEAGREQAEEDGHGGGGRQQRKADGDKTDQQGCAHLGPLSGRIVIPRLLTHEGLDDVKSPSSEGAAVLTPT